MCGRFNQSRAEQLNLFDGFDINEPQKNSKKNNGGAAGDSDKPKFNIAPGMDAYILIKDFEKVTAEFGFRPSWDPSKMFINARVEGKSNPDNFGDYKVGIGEMPSFKEAYLKRRCIVPVDSFIEGPELEKLSKPYLIEYEGKKMQFLAAIYNPWVTPTGETKLTFAILTTPDIPVLSVVGHHRSPYLLHQDIMEHWLDESMTKEDLDAMLSKPYYEDRMSATPLDPAKVKSGKNHGPDTIEPFGEPIIV